MLLRSEINIRHLPHPSTGATTTPEPQMCGDCNRFWGNLKWDMKCSICSGYCDKSNVSPYWGFDDPEYQKKLTVC